MKNLEVQQKQNTEIQAEANDQQIPAYIKTDQSRGNENMSADDISIPRIDLLQASTAALS